jgi:hypothetical protein
MVRICLKESEIFVRELLNVLRELRVTLPERGERVRLQGNGLKFPASISASTFSSTPACFPPGAKSSSSCLSQAKLSCRAMKAAKRVSSSGDKAATAFSISARLTYRNYREHRVKATQ